MPSAKLRAKLDAERQRQRLLSEDAVPADTADEDVVEDGRVPVGAPEDVAAANGAGNSTLGIRQKRHVSSWSTVATPAGHGIVAD